MAAQPFLTRSDAAIQIYKRLYGEALTLFSLKILGVQ